MGFNRVCAWEVLRLNMFHNFFELNYWGYRATAFKIPGKVAPYTPATTGNI